MDMIIRSLVLCLPLVFMGCGHHEADDHGHAHGSETDVHAPHGTEEATLVYTDYTDGTELFVEFPALIAGRTSTFAAHITRLSDFKPLNSGTLDVLLEAQGKTVARFRVKAPERTGIFAPAVMPRDAGTFNLIIEVTDGELQARHELGSVTVFSDAAAVDIHQSEREGDIGYLKEQQWSNTFATVLAESRPLRPSVPGFATVLAPADASAEVRAPSDGYFAATGIAKAGDGVERGAVLGYLVPRLGEGTDVGSLRVALERARSQIKLAELDVERLQGLFKQGAVPENRLIEARQAFEIAQAELTATRARVEQTQQGNAEAGIALRAPVAGEVVEVNARPGAFVRSGERVFRVAAPERRWLEIRVPERFSGDLRNVSGAWFDRETGEVIVLDADTDAQVVQTNMTIDRATRTASVTLEYPSALGPDLIGARFPAHVFTAAPVSRLVIPRTAVIDDGGRPVVYLQTGGEMFVRRAVELGLNDGGYVEVVRGVRPGERVVSEGAYYVKLAAAGGEEIGHGHAH